MSWQVLAFVCFTLLLQSVGVYSVAQQCYFCNSEVHGAGCNDPIAPENIQIQSCSSSQIVSTSSASTDDEISVRRVRDTYSNVCINMTYTFDSRNVSSRGCETEYILTNAGLYDICSYYAAIIPARITNFNCNVCISDLCNHAGADTGEIEQPEEEFPNPDDDADEEETPEEETPEQEEADDEGEVGETDSAHIVSISFTLLVSLVVGKLCMI
ncbi:hypothetical protein HUJ04_007334 [Dendroctonus ponderosae]|nr:hypothetical protein HUJ04_007334 [Dendroctonus ponderosae]